MCCSWLHDDLLLSRLADLRRRWCSTARPAASTRSTGERSVGASFDVSLERERNPSLQADIWRAALSVSAGIP